MFVCVCGCFVAIDEGYQSKDYKPKTLCRHPFVYLKEYDETVLKGKGNYSTAQTRQI
jgi:hypothetical protein